MTISVLVATYNRARLLEECLAHLDRQQFESGDEIIIVDNGSTDRTPLVIREAGARLRVPVRHLSEPAPGKSRALACAIEAASGHVLAFTDDDVNVEDDWVDEIRRAMRDPGLALAGGPVVPRWEGAVPRWLRQNGGQFDRLASPLALLDYGPRPLDLGPRTLLGANLAIRAEVIRQVGGYSPNLGKLRNTLMSGEDHELCQRVQSAGFRARYVPTIRVQHWVPASRTRVQYLLSWFFWSGITASILDSTEVKRPTVGGIPRYLVRRFAGGLIGAPAAALSGRMALACERAADAAFAAGYAAECWRLVPMERSIPRANHLV
jgi:glycosyltransferase involved in cell wall biosynthesis